MSRTRRSGVAAVEVMLASLLLVAAIVPLMEAFQSSHRVSVHDQLRLLAMRQATEVAAGLRCLPLAALARRATGPEAAGFDDPRIRGRQVELLSYARGESRSGAVRAFFSLAAPGLGRLAVVASWSEGAIPRTRQMVLVMLIEDPEHARRL